MRLAARVCPGALRLRVEAGYPVSAGQGTLRLAPRVSYDLRLLFASYLLQDSLSIRGPFDFAGSTRANVEQ